ncbi:unnamed protein product [Brachionus calyciflorus]|uniref:LIM interaction domain-containing protein n=1 Tax=Brachionus calyciflorus TaxID=104777 RepID=A0A813M624_9BILA|nr:unnamed protein product [Brachionus calyciflorus]
MGEDIIRVYMGVIVIRVYPTVKVTFFRKKKNKGDPAQGPAQTPVNQIPNMIEQQNLMPPQSPLVHQASFNQTQNNWAMNQHQQQQYHQFNQSQRMSHNQNNPISNPSTSHLQMPPPNMMQQQVIQPPSQSPQLGQMSPSVNPGLMSRNQQILPQGINSNFPQQGFLNQQQQQQFPMPNQIHSQPNPNQFSHHSNMMPQPPPPQMPTTQVINLPLPLQPEYKIYEMNKRLSNRPDQLLLPVNHPHYDPNISYLWYDSFVNEFFDENAKLTIKNVTDENGNIKHYTLSRSMIPRFFRSFSDGSCTELNFQILRGHIINVQTISNNGSHHQIIFYESDPCILNCKLGKPMYAKVCTEGKLLLECILEPSSQQQQASGSIIFDSIKIKHFTFMINRHQELVPRSTICMLQDPNQLEQLSTNITRMGLTQQTLKYLKICSVLEPMQELMLKHRLTGLTPRDCLRNSAAQRSSLRNIHPSQQHQMPTTPTNPPINSPFQRSSSIVQNEEILNKPADTKAVVNPSDNSKTPSKRRKRKSSPTNSSPNEIKKEPGSATKSKKGSAAPVPIPQNQSPSPVFNYNQTTSGYGTPIGQMGDVMVVGEPSLMGGDFGEQDERLITRLENNQFDSMNINFMNQQVPNHIRPNQFMQHSPIGLRPNTFHTHSQNSHLQNQQMVDDIKQPMSMVAPSPLGNIHPPSRPPSSLPPSLQPPPRPQSTSHFLNSNTSLVDQQHSRSLTPSPSTSNLLAGLAPKTPTPNPSQSNSLTPTQNNQMIDLNLNGNLIASSNISSATSSKSPSLNNNNNNTLPNGIISQQSQQQQPPSTSTSSSAIASSSATLSPNSIFNSTNNGLSNNSVMSPGSSNKQMQLNADQSQQKSIFLPNF